MSNSVQLHRWQPTRLPLPWDSPGKNTGVGFHFLLQCMKERSESEVTQSCPTLSDPMDWSPAGSSVHGIFQARVLEWGAIAFSSAWKWKVNVKSLSLIGLVCQVYHHICLLWGRKSTEVLNWELYSYLFNKLQRTEADWFLFFNAFSFLLLFNFWQWHVFIKTHVIEGTNGSSSLTLCILSLSLHLPLSSVRNLSPGYYNSHIYLIHSNSCCI